jgi:uncharacterized repeat protein (TIGR03806 family)
MKLWLITAWGIGCFIIAQSFNIHQQIAGTEIHLLPKLSDYHLYSGKLSDLTPGKGFVIYELATPLFSDYAEKQRLIGIPKALAFMATGDGLPQFPDGTILVKTFFYWQDKRDTSRGKRIIETRILLRSKDAWEAGTYVWNAAQNEALLTTTGLKTGIRWLDEKGAERNIDYRVPSVKQCATCHYSGNTISPIGFKIRNLNITVRRNNDSIRQLQYFVDLGIAAPLDPSSFSTLPAWNDSRYTLEQRARAYLDINCAHCHNEKGFCSRSDFRPAYENDPATTRIAEKKGKIIRFLRSGRMPLLGTTVLHEEGIQLIEDYLRTIKKTK